ncbi:MAG: hypothetical protein LBC18_15475 [Opitutaceae bacterium]|jgi:hypothetical protein|nr:hypothetical protein [Opitutaceae bacterium]
MSFIVFKGTLKAASDADGFTKGATYAYVCVAAEKDFMRALEAANSKAKREEFIIETVDGSPISVPAWRSFLPTSQGRALREARHLGAVITVCSEVIDPERVVGEESG